MEEKKKAVEVRERGDEGGHGTPLTFISPGK